LLSGQLENLESGLRELRREADVELHERVDLRAWTALGVGGVAALMIRCHNASAVQRAIDMTSAFGIGWVTLGGGSRLIPGEAGIRVPVISLTGSLARWEPELDGLVSGAGANLAQVCRAASRTGLAGLGCEVWRGHTVGGLVLAASDGLVGLDGTLEWIEAVRPGGGVERIEIGRESEFPARDRLRRHIVTRARFRLQPVGLGGGNPRVAPARPGRAVRTTGPVFLDTPDATAADLLDEAGCANLTVGGVRLGGPNGNDLIAGRSATSTDVLDLCRMARDRVTSVTGGVLTVALRFVDEYGAEIEP
jgi:UDP-N-acetylmuramate dehydrogenase